MPDAIFDDPRLASVYDDLDPDRRDLAHYVAIVEEFGARSVLDVGCGTGTFACLLSGAGVDVVGLDPARASLDVARSKQGAHRVRWVLGDAAFLPTLAMDMATMTGNVAQVFLSDDDWNATLAAIHRSLRAGGHLIFETRDPARRAWEEWTRERTFTRVEIDAVGAVESWEQLTAVSLPLVSFESHINFELDGARFVSTSTLRFRGRDEVAASLATNGYEVLEVREAPDRPGREFVFVARAIV